MVDGSYIVISPLNPVKAPFFLWPLAFPQGEVPASRSAALAVGGLSILVPEMQR